MVWLSVRFYHGCVWQRLNFSRSSRVSVFTAGVSGKEFIKGRWSFCFACLAKSFSHSVSGSIVSMGVPGLVFISDRWKFCFTSPVLGKKLRSPIMFLSPPFTSLLCQNKPVSDVSNCFVERIFVRGIQANLV